MYKSTEWALSKARPRVLIGENAPRLFGSFGQMVAIKLRMIADRYGYKLTLVKTSTHFHGLPQKRERSFFVLFRDLDMPPVFERQDAQFDGHWTEFLNSFDSDDTEGEHHYSEHAEEMWRIITKGMGKTREEVRDVIAHNRTSLLIHIVKNMPWVRDSYISEHLDSEDKLKATLARRFKYTRDKWFNTGSYNVWDTSPLFINKPYYPSVMHRTVERTYRSDLMRTITPREQMRLMGLPESMDVPRSYINAIAQNVPTCTAGWIIKEALAALNGERPFLDKVLTGDRIFRQSNINGSSLLGMEAGNHITKLIDEKVVQITSNFEIKQLQSV